MDAEKYLQTSALTWTSRIMNYFQLLITIWYYNNNNFLVLNFSQTSATTMCSPN